MAKKQKEKVYDPELRLDANGNRPYGMYYPIHGIYFLYGSRNYRLARKALRARKRAERNEQWKQNAIAEIKGEFVPDPGSVFPVEVQRRMHEEGNWKSKFWQGLYSQYVGELKP